MNNHELNNHKKSDSIKWAVAFTLIAVLLLGMITSIVMAFKGDEIKDAIKDNSTQIEQPLDKDDNTDNSNGGTNTDTENAGSGNTDTDDRGGTDDVTPVPLPSTGGGSNNGGTASF